ncbi:aldehyde dehydrogenase family protein [Gordonia sp. NPDC003429]
MRQLLETLQETQRSGVTRPIAWRKRQLAGLRRLVDDNESAIAEALADDLGRGPAEAWLGDVSPTIGEIDYALKHLRRWMRPERVRLPLSQQPGRGRVVYEPLGVVLVIGPWNYPIYLTLSPMVAALAAGNCVVVKPSELAPASSALIADLVPRYLDTSAVAVIEGDGAVTQELLALGFDHALFTGGTEIGRKIMAGAAPTLTPVTLELGGKSPVYVAADADLEVAARRIAWVKLLNSGQTCVAPDYVLADRQICDDLVARIGTAVAQMRGGDLAVPIVNDRQFARLTGYLDTTSGAVSSGGSHDPQRRTIEPTVLVDPKPDDPVMTEEIFGPILPVLAVDGLDEVVEFVTGRPKPLAMYTFTGSAAVRKRIIAEIPAGGMVFNHLAMQVLCPQLPFGGVGPSGMGAYHGIWGFRHLSHRKAVLTRASRPDPGFVYPPYTPRALKLMRRLL